MVKTAVELRRIAEKILNEMDEDLKKDADGLVTFLRDYFYKSGAKKVIIGNSGGKDCNAAIAAWIKAIGKENVISVAMPCCSSSTRDIEDAHFAAEHFGIESIDIELTETYKVLVESIEKGFGKLSEGALINLKPILRMAALNAIVDSVGGLLIGTGNFSEIFLGYFTKRGDGLADLYVNKDFLTDEVIAIGLYLGAHERNMLRVPDDGISGLTDEQKIGVTYEDTNKLIRNATSGDEEKDKIIRWHHERTIHKRMGIPYYKRQHGKARFYKNN